MTPSPDKYQLWPTGAITGSGWLSCDFPTYQHWRTKLHVNILGRRWKIERASLPNGDYGNCDHPSVKGKRIRIQRNLDGLPLLETLLHEMLHAAAWEQWDEEFVERLANDLAKALDRYGYRLDDQAHRPGQ